MDEYRNCANGILSGIILSITTFCYATYGSIIGAILFSFGLLTIILYGFPLYTGSAGFIKTKEDIQYLFGTLIGNVLGCGFGAVLIMLSGYTLQDDFIYNATQARMIFHYVDFVPIFIRAICCGLIMTIAVKFAREAKDNKNFMYVLPLLLGIPIFLLSGFYHSIVDAFYFIYSFINPHLYLGNYDMYVYGIFGWCTILLGNFVGCNFIRLITLDLDI